MVCLLCVVKQQIIHLVIKIWDSVFTCSFEGAVIYLKSGAMSEMKKVCFIHSSPTKAEIVLVTFFEKRFWKFFLL